MKRGKKYAEAAKAVNRANLYDPEEAISLVKDVYKRQLQRCLPVR